VTVPEQVGYFLERCFSGEFVNIVATVNEFAFLTEDMRQRRGCSDDALEPI
jgi:hypothetical protein